MPDPSRLIYPAMPSVLSPIWPVYAEPLCAYLISPKSMDEIIAWASQQNISKPWITNVLAWLSFRGDAKYDDGSKCWVQGSDYA
jgi:hypothetical protein